MKVAYVYEPYTELVHIYDVATFRSTLLYEDKRVPLTHTRYCNGHTYATPVDECVRDAPTCFRCIERDRDV